MRLSIVIPAYNEERRIGRTLSRVIDYVNRNSIDAEIIVVDDGSTDGTAKLVEDISAKDRRVKIIQNGKNRGKGFSVRNGVRHSSGDYILFTDADNSTPIQEVRKLLSCLEEEGYDIAIGSRALERSKVRIRQPWFRMTMGKTFNLLVRLFLYGDFMDTQCGFKCFTKEAALDIFRLQMFDGFSFDIEVLAIAKLKGYRIKEVPVVWVNSLQSRVNPVKDAFRMLCDIFRLKYNLFKKIYT